MLYKITLCYCIFIVFLTKNSRVVMHPKVSTISHIFQHQNLDVKRTFKSKHEIHHQKTFLESEHQVSTA